MKTKSLFKIATLFARRRYKVMLLGAQLGYKGYKYLKRKRKTPLKKTL